MELALVELLLAVGVGGRPVHLVGLALELADQVDVPRQQNLALIDHQPQIVRGVLEHVGPDLDRLLGLVLVLLVGELQRLREVVTAHGLGEAGDPRLDDLLEDRQAEAPVRSIAIACGL
jgi:hypothetical protein